MSLFLVFVQASAEAASCFDQAGDLYHVSPSLLRAIAKQESGMNPRAIHINRDGTKDYGLMQINERWFPHLKQLGISGQKLMEPCQNIHVSAYILRLLFNRHGENWRAVGRYNASHPVKAAGYAWKIHKKLKEVKEPLGVLRR